MKKPLACIAYGSTPRDPQEAFYNRQSAETLEEALKTLGWETLLLGLTNTDSRPIPPNTDLIFNLCDGDEESRFEIVRFAKELETLHKPYTGSSPKILQYCKDKTLKWMKSCPVPKYWDTPPNDPMTQKFLTKPREAHGSLLITEENINGTHNFSPKDYFFQEYLGGPEYTTIFINNKFLGQALVKETGILTRDDKWEPKKFENTERIWDHSGATCPKVREVAEKAWAEMQALDENPRNNYGKVDIRLNKKGQAYVIDMNPNGYLGLDGTIATCWKSLGGSYPELVEELIKSLH